MADKIQVAVRVRPVLLQKKDIEIHWCWAKGMVFQAEPGTQKRIGNPYLFDQVFGTEAQNYQIFTELVQPLIDSAMNGFNVTVLAYGQTASGKTYTMMGSQKELGIVQLAVERIFSLIEQNPERAFLLRCSYIEIYNESISDLLSSTHQKLKVQELAEGHVIVHNLIETNVNTPDAVLKLMQQGNKQRKVGGTSMNERSSRSHTIFRIIVESLPRDEADRSDAAVIVSHINLVDLAGSEKASQTNATGDRFREGCAINTSLSALSLVIKQLSEGEGFVNFRDSKLTHILRASLGGNARTAIICNVTPTVLDETSSTLKFACSAKAVQNQPHVNEVLSDQALLRKYNNYIKDLEKKLKEKELEKKPEAIEEMQRLLQEKDMKINELKEQLVVSSCSDVASGRPDNSLTCAQRSLRRMTWGGNRLRQELRLLGPSPLDMDTPPVPRSERVPRTVSQVFASRQSSSNLSGSDMAIDEMPGDSDGFESETFLPAEMVFNTPSDQVAKVNVGTMTDVAASPFKQPSMPCTPVPVLRERVHRLRMTLKNKEKENEDLREELEDLTNFTRLEQEIGVHAQVTAKNVASPESADQLHRALQTANDMELLYLDTHRKLSELQTEFRTKESEHQAEILSQQKDFQQRLETEQNERKRLSKELSGLKDKFNRLERDHLESDTHVQVISERYAKRETDLRNTLQEAWNQLEQLGQNPKAIQENFDAKQKLIDVETELLEMHKRNDEAQSRIDSLTEELRHFKESAMQTPYVAKNDDQMHDSSLNGMCLADELRDMFAHDDCSFVSRSVHQTRKRPSSILSVALEKMDQSTCILDSTHEIEPSKKTRLTITSDQSDDVDVLEIKQIREYLVELQSVLLRYEKDFETQSQEKEALTNQLLSAQNELASIRQEKNKCRIQEEKDSPNKFDNSNERFDSSSMMVDPSISTSIMNMEQSCGSDDEFVSLREQLGETCGSLTAHESSERTALIIQKVDDSNKRKQELEEEVSQMAARIVELQEELASKTITVEQSLRSLETAQSTITILEQRDAQRQQLILNLGELEGKILLLCDESTVVSNNLDSARQILTNIRNEVNKLSEKKDVLDRELEKANKCLEAAQTELKETLERLPASNELEQKSNVEYEKTSEDLSYALEKIEKLKVELELKTAEVHAAQTDLEQTRSRMEEIEQSSFEKIQLEELVEKLTDQLDGLQDTLDSKVQELAAVQEAEKQASTLQKENFDTELEKKLFEINQARGEIAALRLELHSTTADLKSAQQELEEFRTRSQELLHLNEQLETEKKEAVVLSEALEEQIRIKSIAMEKAQKELEEVRSNGSEVDSLRNALEKARAQVEELQVYNEQLLGEISLAKLKVEELGNDLQSKIDTLSAIEKEATSKQHEFAVELDMKLQVIDRLEVNLQETNARLAELQSMKETVQNDLAEATRRIEDLQENLESQCDAHLALQLAAEQAASIATTASKNHLEEKEKTERQLLDLHEKIKELTGTLDETMAALEAAKAEILRFEQSNRITTVSRKDYDELQSEWKEAIQRVSQLEASLEEKSSQVENLSRNLESYQTRSLALEHEEQARSTQIVSLERNIEVLASQNASLSKEIEQYQSDLQSKEEKLASLGPMTQKISMLQARLEKSDIETNEMSRNLEKKEEEMRCLQEELSRVIDSQSNSKEELKHAEQRLHETQKELGCIRTSLESMQSANDDLLTQLNDKEYLNDELRKDLTDTTQRFDILHSKLQLVQSEKSSLLDRVQLLETELECRDREIGDIRNGLSDIQTEREVTSQLKQRLNSLQVQYNDAVNQCEKLRTVRDEILEHQERSSEEILRLTSKLQLVSEEKTALEQNKLLSESQKDAILRDYQSVKTTLIETENQLRVIQGQRDDFCNQIRILNDQFGQVRAKVTAFESGSIQEPKRKMEETIDSLKREIVDARSNSEILRLNFETEENARKKKIERLEKELDSVKQQHVKCKEQLRLLRYGPNEEATVNLPKPRVSISVDSISIQTDPIADKGFGFRWQMEQYVSDNERLRKKVSDLGERMEFYKEKLIKYRTMYFQMTGQDPQRPSSSSSNNSSQPIERQSSISAGCRENIADCPPVEAERNLRTKNLAPIAAVSVTGNPLPVSLALQEQHQEEMKARLPKAVPVAPALSTRWPAGAKKESLTKEEMEKINNCNPS